MDNTVKHIPISYKQNSGVEKYLTLLKLTMVITISIIFAIGLVMIFNTTSAEVLDHSLDKSTRGALARQIAYAGAGIGLIACIRRAGYEQFLNISYYLLLISIALLLLCLMPGIGRAVNGSKRWIQLFGFSFQPSEFAKYIIAGYVIQHYLCSLKGNWTFQKFIRMLGVVAIPMFLTLIEPNNGTVGVMGLLLLVLFILGEIPAKYWAIPLVVMCVIVAVSAYHLPYVRGRVQVYLHPELDLKGKGHQPYQAKIAAGSGKLWGKGPGNSLQKLSYLPEAQNDYIAAIYAEEFGFTGICFLIALYLILASCGFGIALHAETEAAYYMAASAAFLISFQAFMNLGVVSGLLPSTGLNLPFFSQGGTSLMANLMGVGLLLDIASRQRDNK